MKYIKKFEEINIENTEKVDEGVKEWILAGALAAGKDGVKRQTTTNHITADDFEYIKKNFEVK